MPKGLHFFFGSVLLAFLAGCAFLFSTAASIFFALASIGISIIGAGVVVAEAIWQLHLKK